MRRTKDYKGYQKDSDPAETRRPLIVSRYFLQVVANCHQLPENHFLRYRLTVEEIVEDFIKKRGANILSFRIFALNFLES